MQVRCAKETFSSHSPGASKQIAYMADPRIGYFNSPNTSCVVHHAE